DQRFGISPANQLAEFFNCLEGWNVYVPGERVESGLNSQHSRLTAPSYMFFAIPDDLSQAGFGHLRMPCYGLVSDTELLEIFQVLQDAICQHKIIGAI